MYVCSVSQKWTKEFKWIEAKLADIADLCKLKPKNKILICDRILYLVLTSKSKYFQCLYLPNNL